MEKTDKLSTFKTINNDIKTILGEIDEQITSVPCFDYDTSNKNNEAFIEILDKLLDARSAIEALKKNSLES